MRLHSITLRNYRGITDRTITFDDGITVVEGPNEVGKSSVPEAMMLLRTYKDSSTAQRIRAISPVHADVAPEAQMELSTGPYRLRYAKRWLKQPRTELEILAPHHEQHTGLQAHERFEQILAETIDVGLLDALEVPQGESMAQAPLAQLTALQKALGDDPDSGGNDELATLIDAEYGRWFTAKNGHPRGEYAKAQEAVPALEQDVQRLRARSVEMESLTSQHEVLTQRIEQMAHSLTEAEQEASRWRAEAKRLGTLKDAVDSSTRVAEQARDMDQRAQERLQDRDHAIAQVTRERAACDEAARQVLEATGLANAARGRASAAEAECALAQERLQQRADALRAATTALEHARSAAELATLSAQVAQAQRADGARREALAALEAEPITEAAEHHLVELHAALREARAAYEAAATVVSVEALGAQPVLVDGAPIPGGGATPYPVLDAMQVRVEGVVAVTVSPGLAPGELRHRYEEAERRFDDALAEAGVASLEDARAGADRRRLAKAAHRDAETALTHALAGGSLAQLKDRLATLAAKLAPKELPDAAHEPADVERILADLEALTESRDDAAQVAARAHEESERLRREAQDAGMRLAIATARLEQLQDQAADTARRLEDARERLSDDALAAQREDSRERLKLALAALERDNRALAAADPQETEAWLDNAEGNLESASRALTEERERLIQTEALLERLAAEGIFDELTDALARLRDAQDRLERLERRASAAALLRRTIQRQREQVQARYVAPFEARITALGRIIFGEGFAVEITPDLHIASRTLDGRTVSFTQLSGGAQEQLALLARLACAQLVDPLDGAPLILDDTLGFSDPMRLKSMGLALQQVGRNAQIILLTCQPDRYRHVGDARRVSLY